MIMGYHGISQPEDLRVTGGVFPLDGYLTAAKGEKVRHLFGEPQGVGLAASAICILVVQGVGYHSLYESTPNQPEKKEL